VSGTALASFAEGAADPAAHANAIENWRELRFGMFIHWGPVALTGREIGWSRGKQTPAEKYDGLYKQFNPVKFNAAEWAEAAKAAGMKYLVITAKHHDGFCIWDSAYTDYDIMSTPYKKDILKELAEECRKRDILFCTYYSICDWWHPDYPTDSPGGRGKKAQHDMPRYVEYLNNQTTELINKYGPIGIMWFDGEWEHPWTKEYGNDLYRSLKALQPDIVVNNRVGKGRHGMAGTTKQDAGNRGDYDTPEQRVGGFNRERPWETCMTICRQWAWKPNDNMKSLKQCLQTLIQTVGGDGNLLFNVGPTAEGIIEKRQVERLKGMGAWLEQYGDGIYGTRGGPFKPGKWGASTCKGKDITLFVMQRPSGGVLQLPDINAKIEKVETLTAGEVSATQADGMLSITLPTEPGDEISDVIRLKLDRNAFDLAPVVVRHVSHSLAYGKAAKASNVYRKQNAQYGPAKALDDDPETRWATDAGVHSAWLEIDLGEAKRVGRLHVDEREWNRVQSYQLEFEDGGEWKVAHSGKKIGAGHEAAFNPVTARRFRLNILKATDGPTLWEVHLLP